MLKPFSCLLTLLIVSLLPILAPAATTSTIHAEWTRYVPPSGYTVSGYRLYQEGQMACQTTNPSATSLDCQVTLNAPTVYFTLTATFTNGTETGHSAPFAFSAPASTPGDIKIETGEVDVNSNWQRITFESTFSSPIVIAGPPTTVQGAQPCVVRIRNITSTGFEIRLTEWEYQDGIHSKESVSYVVTEKGSQILPDGSSIEAGSFTGRNIFRTIPFSGTFAHTPIVLTTIASVNDSTTISGRLRNINIAGFDYTFREQEANIQDHANEIVNYIAWEPGNGTIGSMQYSASIGNTKATHEWKSTIFQSPFTQAPFLISDMQTTNGADPCALRVRNLTTNTFQVKVEEEQSKDTEVEHLGETIGYLALGPVK